jgi:DNA-binding PadR family transcriptional regulator
LEAIVKLQDVYCYFQSTQPIFLNEELAVCYILSILLEMDSYGTELIQHLEAKYTPYHLSDTVMYNALKFLEKEVWVQTYWQKVEGRGRPRRMYRLASDVRTPAQEFAQLWNNYITSAYGERNLEEHPQFA